MDRIWAPWRMEYISNSNHEEGCIFCNAWNGSDDRGRLLLFRMERSMLMLNKYPYSGGHLMVAPVRHTPDPEDLNDADHLELMKSVCLARRLLNETVSPQGMNIGINLGRAAGAGIEDHLHVHIVPRWNGDTNFMTVTGDLRVIPEGLMACYDRLSNKLRRITEG